ncbi:MAG: L-threonylcarbamoyladenylate synthase [Terriglobales bacterium]
MSERLRVDPQAPEAAAVARARAVLEAAGVVAAPTDTVYGLLANALSPRAVARVYALKGRGFDKPLPVLVASRAQARALAGALPPSFERLAQAFWPGALTLVVPAAPSLPATLTAGSGAVGLRHANLPLIAALLEATGYPLTGTSANRSGAPDAIAAGEVAAQLGVELDLILDGGPAPGREPSTVVALTGPRPLVVREGAIAASRLAAYF